MSSNFDLHFSEYENKKLVRLIDYEKEKQTSEYMQFFFLICDLVSPSFTVYVTRFAHPIICDTHTALQTQIDSLKSQIDETEKQNALLSREVQDVERQITASQSLITTSVNLNYVVFWTRRETHN
jgi:septal ring factor EnvC (AmiA/AmiB activator)